MIKIGRTYIVSKSGSEVKVLERAVITLNGKEVSGFSVRCTESGKTMLVPREGLREREEDEE